MPTTERLLLPSSIISTAVRAFDGKSLRRLGFRAFSALAPERAADKAARLFGHPPRVPRSQAEWSALERARHFVLPFASGRLAAWRWGPADAPQTLLVHGWGGRGGQLRAFVPALVAAGHSVLCFDAPGHGLSEGERSGPVALALALEEVIRRAGPVAAVIAHSMGGPVTAYAMSRGAPIPRAVLVAPPTSYTEFSQHFARELGASEATRRAMQRRMEYHWGVRWSELDVERILPALRAPALVIHDSDDREVPIAHGEHYAAHWPGARLLRTRGLGHRRILGDAAVVAAATAFAAARPGDAS